MDTTNSLKIKESFGFVGQNGWDFDIERMEINPVIDAIEKLSIKNFDSNFNELTCSKSMKHRSIVIFMLKKSYSGEWSFY